MYVKIFVSFFKNVQHYLIVSIVSAQIRLVLIIALNIAVYNSQSWLAQNLNANYKISNAYITKIWKHFFTCLLTAAYKPVTKKFYFETAEVFQLYYEDTSIIKDDHLWKSL